MSEGKRGRHMKQRRSDTNFEEARLDKRQEYGRTGRYRPRGLPNSPGKKTNKISTRIALRPRNA